MYIHLHGKYQFSDFNGSWISTDFRKTLISNFIKIRPVREILTYKSCILTKVCCYFPHFLHEMPEYYLKLGHHFFTLPLQSTIH